jgi:hypothetical protein
MVLSSRKYDPGCSSRIRILTFTHPGSRIPDPGVKKAPDPDPQHRKKLQRSVSYSNTKWRQPHLAKDWLKNDGIPANGAGRSTVVQRNRRQLRKKDKTEHLRSQLVKGRLKQSCGTPHHHVYHKTAPAASGKEKLWGFCAIQVE